MLLHIICCLPYSLELTKEFYKGKIKSSVFWDEILLSYSYHISLYDICVVFSVLWALLPRNKCITLPLLVGGVRKWCNTFILIFFVKVWRLSLPLTGVTPAPTPTPTPNQPHWASFCRFSQWKLPSPNFKQSHLIWCQVKVSKKKITNN